MSVTTIDRGIITFFRRIFIPWARGGLFVIFFWFGLLKVIGLSPASGLVQQLFEKTIHWIPFPTFLICFGLFEMLIGLLFLFKGTERVVIPLLLIHMVTTFMPLFLLTSVMWTYPFVPTLEGQYIIKNLALIAAAIGIASHMRPLPNKS